MKLRYIHLLLSLFPFISIAQSTKMTLGRNGVFTENKGQISDQYHQARPDILFSGNMGKMNYFLSEEGISYQFYEIENSLPYSNTAAPFPDLTSLNDELYNIYRTDIQWLSTNKNFTIEKGKALPGYENFYLAVCPNGVTGVESFEDVTYKNLYPGIDLKWYNNRGQLEYDYRIAAGIDYRLIKWEIKGAEELLINEKGELVIKTPLGEITEAKPIAFQEGVEIGINWLLSDNTVGFHIPHYDPSKPLLIDPVVKLWSCYMGGGANDYTEGCEIDGADNIYFPGLTRSLNYIATVGSHQNSFGGSNDGFLAKFSKYGSPRWITYYGGSQSDIAHECSVDKNSNIYLIGSTNSNAVIATSGSHQSVFGGGSMDGYIAKFDSNGVRIWGSYYGGPSSDGGEGSVVDASGNVYLAGYTTSMSGIATPGSEQDSLSGSSDAYLVKFNSSGTRLWATYVGGSNNDLGIDCNTDDLSNVYVTGRTFSTDKIATTGSNQETYGGGGDAFLVKLNGNGVKMWGTYLGGTSDDWAINCVPDKASAIYIFGYTQSTTSIASAGSYQSTNAGGYDGFIAKFDLSGEVLWSTYYGGPNNDYALNGIVDENSDLYFTGTSESESSIATPGSHQEIHAGGRDGFLVKMDKNGNRYWGTYFGGEADDQVNACAVSQNGEIYMTGGTKSTSNIASTFSYQSTLGGDQDAFIAGMQSVVGFQERQNSLIQLNIYPNPTKGSMILELDQPVKDITVYVYNLLGQKIQSRQFDHLQKTELNLTGEKGIYFLEIVTADEKYTVRVVVE